MMHSTGPLVSVGVPVFNGAGFLAEALESLLSQTHDHLEIIICDNASTDGTQEICEAFAARDTRVRYFRNARNLGAARNYNLTVRHATGGYFKWAAHDDVSAPTFIERCVQTLEQNPAVVLAYPKTIVIDEHGSVIDDRFEDGFNFRDAQPHHRYRAFTESPLDCNAVFGVMRIDSLRKTPCIGPYESSDRVLLGELALLGQIAEVPERLFLRRRHPRISTIACDTKQAMASWFDPSSSGRFSRLRRLLEYLKSLRRAPLTFSQRMYCLFFLLRFYVRFYFGPRRWTRQVKKNPATAHHRFSVSIPQPHVHPEEEVF